MPTRPAHVCGQPGCPALVVGAPRCPAHQPPQPKRGSSTQQGYGSKWRKAKAAYLAVHRWCVECQRHGHATPSTCIDHIVAHKGNRELFWNRRNWRASCISCNSSKAAREEGGFGNARKHQTAPGVEPPRPLGSGIGFA